MIAAPRIAIIGRTNVGKSSLFNKLVEEQKSLVSPIPGTTRDRFEADCLWRGAVMRLIDTGGLDVAGRDEIERNTVLQAEKAIEQADLIYFVVDLKVGPLPDDLVIAKKLRAAKKPVIVIGNKADNAELRRQPESGSWLSWPLSKPLAISAKQGTGLGDVLDASVETLIKMGKPPVEVGKLMPMRVCVIGEPNVGKSTLLNSLLGEERFITANVPHTTREPNDVLFEHDDQLYMFLDTAGVRKQASRRRSGTELEQAGVAKSIALLARSEVALFVIDGTKGITAQERHLAGVLNEARVSVIIVANKWDLVPDKHTNSMNEYEARIRSFLPQLDYAPILFTSALTGKHTPKVFDLIQHVFKTRFTQLSDNEARQFMNKAIVRHRPMRGKGVKSPKVTRFAQSHINPPVFTLEVNLPRKDSLAVAYVRFLENRMREQYDFLGTPIDIRVSAGRKSHTTY